MRKTVVLSATLLPLMISSGMVYSVLPIYISEELGASRTEVGGIFTLGATVGLVTAYLLGRIADRIGRKPLILLAQCGFAFVMLAYSLINDRSYAYLIQVFEGLSWTMLGVSASALIADITEKGERGEAMGIYSTSWSMGWVLGPITGGLLSDMYGFRFMLRTSFLMLVIGLAASYLVLRKIEE